MSLFPIIPSELALWVLRIVFGAIFLVHGWPKLKGLRATAENFEMMGFRPGKFWGTFIAFLEVFGGLAIILGIYTETLATLFAIEMAVATIWKMKRGQKFVGGIELDLILFASGLILSAFSSSIYSFGGY
ncbi:MAG: hypothetical protein UY12_C0008G0003 [Parcubacteria group bacterium GW2011_GWA2_47_8b]|uniref:DoxX family protein n=1 Tax=Candidatus Harrisonbacteria bacterium RIFCSPHIGHO2_12_FULL_48_16 TaxID=1798405 RepID=A0A1G1ZI77_9BACT|nr:MAG: hypothetical protein UY12_C0008G0003 [Parcubacteria group bacterium GW2011_GWA2_47_8b]KKU94586.1 MAG: hypothetical protein UY24_C0013G0004 [Parcubacteria group bacterium GW2011_GWA1_48_11b]OGY64272.1 MAG: hypothetical protein A3E64_00605 [Candidatus Harrisonbacteria bacterium RIFCSPHIGHO2_12_FULL_48_16]HLD34793.1 DoxX family protein [Patescibacteria group bacterium]